MLQTVSLDERNGKMEYVLKQWPFVTHPHIAINWNIENTLWARLNNAEIWVSRVTVGSLIVVTSRLTVFF